MVAQAGARTAAGPVVGAAEGGPSAIGSAVEGAAASTAVESAAGAAESATSEAAPTSLSTQPKTTPGGSMDATLPVPLSTFSRLHQLLPMLDVVASASMLALLRISATCSVFVPCLQTRLRSAVSSLGTKSLSRTKCGGFVLPQPHDFSVTTGLSLPHRR